MQNTVNPNATEKAKVLLNFLSETAGKSDHHRTAHSDKSDGGN